MNQGPVTDELSMRVHCVVSSWSGGLKLLLTHWPECSFYDLTLGMGTCMQSQAICNMVEDIIYPI